MILSATFGDRIDYLCRQGVAGRFAVVCEVCVKDFRKDTRDIFLTRNAKFCVGKSSIVCTQLTASSGV